MAERLFLPSVTNVLADRKKANSLPLRRDDPFKVGLVIEGGCMRGIVAGGIPLDQAIDDGCSHVLVLSTRPFGQTKTRGLQEIIACPPLFKNGFRKLALSYWKDATRSNVIRHKIARMQHDSQAPTRVVVLELPPDKKEVNSIETKAGVLRQAALDGYEVAINRFRWFKLPVDERVAVV